MAACPGTINRAPRAVTLPVSEIAGVLLNAVFLDSLESDVERLERINRTLTFTTASPKQPLRTIPILVLRPSTDLGRLAAHQYARFPFALRYLLKGIGASGGRGWNLLSYLAFEPVYIALLLDLGYRDTLARRDAIQAFFAMP